MFFLSPLFAYSTFISQNVHNYWRIVVEDHDLLPENLVVGLHVIKKEILSSTSTSFSLPPSSPYDSIGGNIAHNIATEINSPNLGTVLQQLHCTAPTLPHHHMLEIMVDETTNQEGRWIGFKTILDPNQSFLQNFFL